MLTPWISDAESPPAGFFDGPIVRCHVQTSFVERRRLPFKTSQQFNGSVKPGKLNFHSFASTSFVSFKWRNDA